LVSDEEDKSMTPEASPAVRADALHLVSNGVYVLTSCVGENIHAATVSWVSQVSMRPPLVVVALQKNSHLVDAVRKAHRFALNVLGAGQEVLAETFFTHWTAPEANADLMAGYVYRPGMSHCPLLKDALAWVECRIAAEPLTPGDHHLILGEVTGAGIRREGTPMVLWNTPWSYGGLPTP
jgi:3-hydroxy-9,10-secoandrosta-1,3,5(10)-triene-9,17-dione monooxygenase reductase component